MQLHEVRCQEIDKEFVSFNEARCRVLGKIRGIYEFLDVPGQNSINIPLYMTNNDG